MNKKGFAQVGLIIAALAVVVAGGATLYFAYRQPLPPTPIVGGDRDEHGCIGSAGYSWCEVKQKCLRVWEEGCEGDDYVLEKNKIQVLSPVGGEILKVGELFNIRWTNYTGQEPLTVALLVTMNNGESYAKKLISNLQSTSTGNYYWIVETEGLNNKYNIEVYPEGGRELVGRSKESFGIYGGSDQQSASINIKTQTSAWFEGWDAVEFGVTVPNPTSNIEGGRGWLSWLAPDNKSKFILDVSYEGGRGYQPKDYFEYEIKKTCPMCKEIGPVTIANETGNIYSDGTTEFSVFTPQNNSTWLFHAKHPASVSAVAKMHLATFWAKKIDKTGEVSESPATIYLVKSSGVAEEYVPVERYIAKTSAIATAAIKELLIGPSLAEKNSGLFSALPLGSELNSLKIENGVAYADFNQQTQSGGGSTSMFLRRDQIGKTLKQFPSIKSVVLSIDGNSRQDLIFQP